MFRLRRVSPAEMIGGSITLLLAIAVAVALTVLRSASFLDSDAAQYLGTASNLLAGDGITSDIIYYEQQYSFGAVPAPQTVFPPGLPVLLAALMAGGASPFLASQLAGLLGFSVTGLLIYVMLRSAEVSRPCACLGAALWFALALGWINVLQGRAEVPFALATVACAMTYLAARGRAAGYFGAGMLCAAAILIRYQGLFLLGALSIMALAPLVRQSEVAARVMVSRAIALVVPPLLVIGALAARNLALVGGPAGGPMDTVRSGLDVPGLVKPIYWMVSEIAGLSAQGVSGGRVAEWLLLAGVAVIGIGIASGTLRPRTGSLVGRAAEADGPRGKLVWLSVVYVLITIGALSILAAGRAGAYLQGRFLVPVVPFVIMPLMILLDAWYRRTAGTGRKLLVLGAVVFHAGILLGQVGALRISLEELRSDQRLARIEYAMREDFGSGSLGQFLADDASRAQPLLAEPAQQAWLALQVPVLGATPAGFSRRIWDEGSIRTLAACYGTRLLLFIPSLFDVTKPQNANKPVFADLAQGRIPGGLKLLHRGAVGELYAIDPGPDRGSCPEPRRPG